METASARPPSCAQASDSSPLSGPTSSRPVSVRTAMASRSVPLPGSTMARTMPSPGRYGRAWTRVRAPARMSIGATPWPRSTIGASGAMRRMTAWHTPTDSSRTPRSDRKTIVAAGMSRTVAPATVHVEGHRAPRTRTPAPPKGAPARRSGRAGCRTGQDCPGRPDVLVEVEQVGRVVAALDLGQALQGQAGIGLAQPARLGPDEVRVDADRVGSQLGQQAIGPGRVDWGAVDRSSKVARAATMIGASRWAKAVAVSLDLRPWRRPGRGSGSSTWAACGSLAAARMASMAASSRVSRNVERMTSAAGLAALLGHLVDADVGHRRGQVGERRGDRPERGEGGLTGLRDRRRTRT